MSEKKRRDITLGEMQDECKLHTHCGGCKYCSTCFQSGEKLIAPNRIDLTDPPRFTEAQMAFWKAWYDIGARNVAWNWKELMYSVQGVPDALTRQFGKITLVVGCDMGLSTETPLDLAELLGKDGESK